MKMTMIQYGLKKHWEKSVTNYHPMCIDKLMILNPTLDHDDDHRALGNVKLLVFLHNG